jgi:hypothetical protein
MCKYFNLFALFLLIITCNQSDNSDTNILQTEEILACGHKFTKWFYERQLDSLIIHIVDENFKIHDLTKFRKEVSTELGAELNIINEQAGRTKKYKNKNWYYYVRYSQYSKITQPVKTFFIFDCNNDIYQFSVEGLPKEAHTNYVDYKTKTELYLPFKGEWYVASGGRKINYNHHVVAKDQRFAYDFLIKMNGATFKNNGGRNEDYFCFGKEIFAPGRGKVVKVVNHIHDNKPGDMPKNAGNYLVINHGHNEFSILAHFKMGSISVKEGDEVEVGQYIGRCGNSGHSSEPHLHYHLQNSPIIFSGEGLPAQFRSYIADEKDIDIGEPFWNQYISSMYLDKNEY